MSITIEVRRADGYIRAARRAEDYAWLCFRGAYEPGDSIRVRVPEPGRTLRVSADECLREAEVHLSGTEFEFRVPFGGAALGYCPKAFLGEEHLITARFALPSELACVRNVAENPLDQRFENGCYPHVTSNAETRGEDVFAARNVADGCAANTSHGAWPYLTWGDNENPLAQVDVRFGRPVELSGALVFLRADFPHDNWWREATLALSGDRSLRLSLRKTGEGQRFSFPPVVTEHVIFRGLVRDPDDPSPFPALAQLMLFGRDV